MSIIIVSKRSNKAIQAAVARGYVTIDVTSNSTDPTFVKFSPFYPHGNIPVAGFVGVTSHSVEGVWQGLKVFEHEGIDLRKAKSKSMKNLKRCVSDKRGNVLGHMYAKDAQLMAYVEARKRIYIPTYDYVLNNYLQNEITLLRGLLNEGQNICFLDYDTNEDVENTQKPLSHASLIKRNLIETALHCSSADVVGI